MAKNKIPESVKSLLDIYQQPFVLVDADFTIVASNKAYAGQYNQTPDDIVGRKCHQVSHNSDLPCAEVGEDCPHRRMFKSGQLEEALHIHTRPDGSKDCVEIKAHPIRGDDGEILYMGEQLRPIETEEMLRDNDLVGRAEVFLDAVREASILANSDLPVLLCGESGVGKERFAAYIHNRSPRSEGPFITLDSCGLNETLFESELFGHEAGAFTDAQKLKKGLFELADGGTLFLDEIGEISPTIQGKLLRVLETGSFRRVGGTATLEANVRIVSATNRNLLDMVEEGTFRRDLYYRLAGHTVTLPALRDRKSDIPELMCFFMKELKKKAAPAGDTLHLLQEYNYPGNIRELKYIVELAILKATDGYIYPEHLPDSVFQRKSIPQTVQVERRKGVNASNPSATDPSASTSPRQVLGMEVEKVLSKLQQCRGSRRSAASELGISERKLYRIIKRCEELGLVVPKPYQ
ncbi:MAG: sigma 54-interacting transcriptional regulator [Gammaproteobacteria bacterium]